MAYWHGTIFQMQVAGEAVYTVYVHRAPSADKKGCKYWRREHELEDVQHQNDAIYEIATWSLALNVASYKKAVCSYTPKHDFKLIAWHVFRSAKLRQPATSICRRIPSLVEYLLQLDAVMLAPPRSSNS